MRVFVAVEVLLPVGPLPPWSRSAAETPAELGHAAAQVVARNLEAVPRGRGQGPSSWDFGAGLAGRQRRMVRVCQPICLVSAAARSASVLADLEKTR